MNNYWIEVIINLKVSLYILTMFSIITIIASLTGAGFSLNEKEEKRCLKSFKIGIFVFFISGIIILFLPSKEFLYKDNQIKKEVKNEN